MRREDQERALEEVIGRVTAEALEGGSNRLEAAIADTIYHERQRLSKQRPTAERARELARWDRMRSQLLAGSDATRRALLREIVEGFAREVLGNFDPKVHALATRAVPVGLAALLHATSPRKLLRWRPGRGTAVLHEHVVVDGELEHIRALRGKGTLICTPTHSSNLDSIILGYAMHEQGFPPLLYGAGLNLFENPLLSFFMHNLGAYKVDRRKTAPIYKQVLKTYAAVSLELGYDNLFFPGGTRARSGAVEEHLKLGLLGTGLAAYANNLKVRRPRPKVFVVPMVLSYELVLEAETLIDDHLREAGQSRYIITDDEFASPRRIFQFLRGLLDLDTKIHLTVMPPRDPFGNLVDREGESLDGRGRPIDIARYLTDRSGRLSSDPNRDQEYTRELGERLVEAFHAGNTILATHVVAFAVFEELRRLNPGLDLYRLLRTGGAAESLPLPEVARLVDALRDRLLDLAAAGRLRLGELVRARRGEELVIHALRAFGTYHTRPALERLGDRIYHRDRNLLYYYRNRLLGYGLEGPA